MKFMLTPILFVLGANLTAGVLVAVTVVLSPFALVSGFGSATSPDLANGSPASLRGVNTLTLQTSRNLNASKRSYCFLPLNAEYCELTP
jgi:hypothetical protein